MSDLSPVPASAVVRVDLPQQPYSIAIAAGLLDRLSVQFQDVGLTGKQVLLVSNPVVFKHYGDRAIAALEAANCKVTTAILPAGERYKTLRSVSKLYDVALKARLERSAVFLALGGGVIGDMTGFAAATWLRGVRVVQVPTSLLAMVDAAIGGKTGVNHPRGKNLIGAFHQPSAVAIDPDVLRTLPAREWRAGMAEVIKYGIIWDRELFERLEAAERLDRLRDVDADLLHHILTHSCRAKAEVVAKDEREGGLRAILNYGHTIGHAVESLTGYRSVNHGEAVAIGMVAAGRLAVKLELWNAEDCDRQTRSIEKAGLPTHIPLALDPDEILAALQADKKVKAGKVRFILPQHIGAVTIADSVPRDRLREVILGAMGNG
ncbi:3-dehydroquinate synthase [Rubidibacter lacunae KORDI 51-2]|uniref:3-dehydroquinate synthase n=1 Tax=Rubidibacter lacunae KORDI 51-2 TaxID=582515 RepID=U5DQM1_9CHRO|nr:3-dehydroquinate synthase [Rubidibacter lacunae]ERN41985.1 3-dehydroquinate synthase [Rubidibacter lacunae KORDI 51-2]